MNNDLYIINIKSSIAYFIKIDYMEIDKPKIVINIYLGGIINVTI